MADYRKKFYSKYVSAHNLNLYGERGIADIRRQFPAWQDFYASFLPGDDKARIADLGCGEGGLVYWLHSLGFSQAEGIDLSGEQIETGRQLGISKIAEADIREFLKDRKDYFDILFLRDVLGHFQKEEVLEVLELCFSALRKGGKILVKTPNAESPLSGRLRYGDITHDTSFTESSLKQILQVSGFKKVSVYPMRPAVHGFKSLTRRGLWHCLELGLRFYRLVEAGSPAGTFTQNVLAVGEK